jgi:2-polyprenyl-6-methoxyphenol hydroxylase-like FAD-dependent oxidoreductase
MKEADRSQTAKIDGMPNDILIIGAGPSGLFAAAELARFGAPSRLIERDVHPHREARATAIQPGTLEILKSVGLLQPFLDSSEHIRCSQLFGPGMTELGSSNYDGLDCCCRFQCSLPQYETQRILEEHLKSLGGAIERGVTATKVDAVNKVVKLLHSNGQVETVLPRFVIGAGGAHSITRHAMSESLEGITYRGHFLVADIAMDGPIPRDQGGVICSPKGFLLMAPLPGGRWISFQDLEEEVESVTADDVVARIASRLDGHRRPTDVAWFAPFRMHRRIVARLADGWRFLVGDAAHLSSPFGGEGLNAGLHDGYDLAWKLALVVRGHAQPSLLDDYSIERQIADRHILEVSDQIHTSISAAADATRQGRPIQPAHIDPIAAALQCNARAMLDVDYSGSPLIMDQSPSSDSPHPGQRYPDWSLFGGTLHRLFVFGAIADEAALAKLERRWASRVQVSRNPNVDPARAGVPNGGMIAVRPDGHIGFRITSVDAGALAALDRHLTSYLIPN